MGGMGVYGQRLLDLLFPPRCASCGTVGAVLCPACLAAFRLLTPPLCARCGTPLPASRAGAGATPLCLPCASGAFPPDLDGIRVAAHYESAVRKAIHALKFGGQRRVAEPLGDLLAQTLQRDGPRADVLVPVPLHPARERERGYNQATLLARRCANLVGVPLRDGMLVRTRQTVPQTHLSASERRSNLAGAFALAGSAGAALTGKRIVLVDDVTTTGSTLAAAAAALLPLHPAAVWGLAVARPDSQHGGDR